MNSTHEMKTKSSKKTKTQKKRETKNGMDVFKQLRQIAFILKSPNRKNIKKVINPETGRKVAFNGPVHRRMKQERQANRTPIFEEPATTFQRIFKEKTHYPEVDEELGLEKLFDEERHRRIQVLHDLKNAMQELDQEHYIEVHLDNLKDLGQEVINFISRRRDILYKQFLTYINEAIDRNDPFFPLEDIKINIEHGSDVMPHSIVRNLLAPTYFEIKRYRNKTGAYWPYQFYDESKMAAMFTEENWQRLYQALFPENHCLIHCIPELEKFFRERDYTANYQTKHLKELAVIGEVKITLTTFSLANDGLNFVNTRKHTFGSTKEDAPHYEIALFQNHYFINDKIRPISAPENLSRHAGFQYRIVDWMKYFYTRGHVYTRNLELRKVQAHYEELYKIDALKLTKTITEKDTEQFIKKKEAFKIEKIIAADTETFPHDLNGKMQHYPYVVGWCEGDLEGNQTYHAVADHRPLDLMKIVKQKLILPNLHKNAIIYFHNLKFDLSVTIDLWNIPGYTMIPTQVDGTIYEIAFYKFTKDNKKSPVPALRVRDSYKMIPQALKNWQKCLNLDLGKMDYEPQLIKNFKDFQKDKENVLEYLKYDCLTLYHGLLKFRKLALDMPGIKTPQDPLKYLTISAYAQGLTMVEGCMEGVCKYSGMAQEYIMKAMMGGRVQCRNNAKQVSNSEDNKIIALDVNSLYPTAMVNMGGLPLGTYKLSRTLPDKYDMYVATFKIIDLTPKAFGVVKLLIDNKNHWITETTNKELYQGKEITIDNITHEDLLKYNDAKLELIGCIYWDNGRNTKLPQLIQSLYDARLELKKAKNPVQEVIKLVLNSVYGKFIQRPNQSKLRIDFGQGCDLHNSDDLLKRTHYRPIKDYRTEYYISEYHDAGSSQKHYNSAHCGISVLSYSKRIMNEQMFTFEGNYDHSKILYTDTDSMYVEVPKEFKEKELPIYHPSTLGKFSNDFDGADSGIKGSFVAPKMYGIVLANGSAKMKCKGITKKALETVCKENYNNDTFAMYDSEERIEFDLSKYKFCPKFETRGYGGCFEGKLVRNVRFDNPKQTGKL